jgi:hypothetical protein
LGQQRWFYTNLACSSRASITYHVDHGCSLSRAVTLGVLRLGYLLGLEAEEKGPNLVSQLAGIRQVCEEQDLGRTHQVVP